jgi:hypothetical protein
MDEESWAEVERMAQAATASDAVESESFPTDDQLERWQRLFKYTRREAFNLIKAQRSDITRTRITDEHWSLVRDEKEAQGHDRETYEHSLQLGNVLKSQSATIPGADGKNIFLFRLGGILGDVERVRGIVGGEVSVVEGQSEMGVANFCLVDEEGKEKIEEFLAQAQLGDGLKGEKA